MIYFTGDFQIDCFLLYQYVDELPLFSVKNRSELNPTGKRPISNVYGTTNFERISRGQGRYKYRQACPEGGFYTKLRTEHPEYEDIFKEFMNEYTDFKYNQVVINHNFEITKHTDAQNVGESYIIGLGDYEGGELCVDFDGNIVEKDIKHQFFTFNGSKYAHWVKPFKGDRYTLVFYNINYKKKI